MRIKYLRIRNIASIEKADIDFENGLQSPGDDSPTPLFLITGDTGSGKSVILDCISMALYGTTPRVKGVANRTNNSFVGSDGNEIKINDISQYTRLGISSKDECYSELTFEGNDGVIYVSKFSLGLVRTGNFRPVGWRLQVGDSDVIEGNKKDEIKKRIVKAVGLTYEQFCRMAMLAQGQFADFLTGGKEERERILEQLTSTQHFSRYGEAIERIYKRTKQKKEYSERLLASESSHLMNAEEEKMTHEKIAQLEIETANIKKRKDNIELILSIFSNIESREKECDEIKKELIDLNEIKAGEDYQAKLRVLQKWDGTSVEREKLRRKKEAMDSLDNSLRNFNTHLSHYCVLSKDFQKRAGAVEEKKKSLVLLNETLNGFEPFREIYENIPLIIEKFSNYEHLSEQISAKENELKKERAETESLKELFLQADRVAIAATAQLKEKKDLIAKLTSNRERLKPEENEKELNNESKRKGILDNITTLINLAEEYDLDLAKRWKENVELKEEAEKLGKLVEISQNNVERLRMQLEEARQRYATMHLSVEENFNSLRQRLAEEKAHTCPLCGQPKEWHNTVEEFNQAFSNILSPLEQESNRLQRECESAEGRHLDIIKRFTQSTGILETQEQTIKTLKERLEKRKKELSNLLPQVDINGELFTEIPDDNYSSYVALRERISDLNVKIGQKIDTLSEIKHKADNLQAEINEEVLKCRPLETEYSRASRNRNDAQTDVLLNAQKILNLENGIKDLKPRISGVEEEIDRLILSHSPKWKENPPATLLLIKKEATSFSATIEKERSITEEINNESKILASLKEIERDIEASIADCQPVADLKHISVYNSKLIYDVESTNLESLPKLWRGVLGDITSEIRAIAKDRVDVQKIDELLDEYYRESGSNETELESLMQKELAIPALRCYLNEIDTKIISCNDTLKLSKKALEELKVNLNNIFDTDRTEPMPDRDMLEKERIYVGIKLEEYLRESGIVKERLQQNEANKKRVSEVAENLEKERDRFVKWDRLNRHFGGTRFRTLVQSYILRPLLRNANVYLSRITDHFTLTCSEQNEQLSILVLDRYNKNKIRSATVLSGGERFMISLALSLALSAMNKPGLNIDILFIDEGFGTLDAGSLNAVIDTLRRLPEIAGRTGRRVGVISHREELADCIDVQIKVKKCGEGRSRVEIKS